MYRSAEAAGRCLIALAVHRFDETCVGRVLFNPPSQVEWRVKENPTTRPTGARRQSRVVYRLMAIPECASDLHTQKNQPCALAPWYNTLATRSLRIVSCQEEMPCRFHDAIFWARGRR